ncbi:MAG: ankyrin repeat domain-containing protein, partial [Pyrinomonadaceae bacterium]|nr:ankyrin repeat domain-containing protein [Pyrinomonadaceae bacterium]
MGERVNAKDKGYGGNSPLHVAVEHGNLEIVQFLLSAGAKINSKNAERQTPLMMLDDDAAPELVNFLLNHRAKINLAAEQRGNRVIRFARGFCAAADRSPEIFDDEARKFLGDFRLLQFDAGDAPVKGRVCRFFADNSRLNLL